MKKYKCMNEKDRNRKVEESKCKTKLLKEVTVDEKLKESERVQCEVEVM